MVNGRNTEKMIKGRIIFIENEEFVSKKKTFVKLK